MAGLSCLGEGLFRFGELPPTVANDLLPQTSNRLLVRRLIDNTQLLCHCLSQSPDSLVVMNQRLRCLEETRCTNTSWPELILSTTQSKKCPTLSPPSILKESSFFSGRCTVEKSSRVLGLDRRFVRRSWRDSVEEFGSSHKLERVQPYYFSLPAGPSEPQTRRRWLRVSPTSIKRGVLLRAPSQERRSLAIVSPSKIDYFYVSLRRAFIWTCVDSSLCKCPTYLHLVGLLLFVQ